MLDAEQKVSASSQTLCSPVASSVLSTQVVVPPEIINLYGTASGLDFGQLQATPDEQIGTNLSEGVTSKGERGSPHARAPLPTSCPGTGLTLRSRKRGNTSPH